MRKIDAYTFVICPVGTQIELFEYFRPSIGREFDIVHIDTKKVVQRARVTSVEVTSRSPKPIMYRVVATIIA